MSSKQPSNPKDQAMVNKEKPSSTHGTPLPPKTIPRPGKK